MTSGTHPAKLVMIFAAIVAAAYLTVGVLVDVNQRKLIYFPTHERSFSSLRPWVMGGQVIGYCRVQTAPRAIWMMTHGNAGQASQRDYVLSHLSDADSFYVLEYPGYGSRAGRPSKGSMDGAALEAYAALRKMFPRTPIGLIGESIGSGPASVVASASPAPDKVVLIVPFDTLAGVASERMPFLPVSVMLRDQWDNIEALKEYRGPIDIYAAVDDHIIPPAHAKRLAASLPRAKLILIEGGHNDWSNSPLVQISL